MVAACIGGACPANLPTCVVFTSGSFCCKLMIANLLISIHKHPGPTTVTTSKCPNNATQLTSVANCLAPTVCPTGYSCVYSLSALNYICCACKCVYRNLDWSLEATTTTTTNRCTNGGTDQGISNCLAPTVCGSGYSCLYSSTAANYICCTTSSTSVSVSSEIIRLFNITIYSAGVCTGSVLMCTSTLPCQCFQSAQCPSTNPVCILGNGLTYNVCCSSSGK
jgi:hypothetical protein